MRLLSWLVVNALALGLATWLFDGITLTGGTDGEKAVRLIVVGAIFGLITAVLRPVVRFLTFPFIILTLGLLLLVINAVMLLLTSKIASSVGLHFHVDGFGTALFGSIVISIALMILEGIFPRDDRR